MQWNELVNKRRSIRSYLLGQPIERAEIEEMLRCAQYAPSWKNSQTGRYYAACSPEAVDRVRAALPEFNRRNSENACALIVSTFIKGVAGFAGGEAVNTPGNEWGAYDLGLQNAYFITKAADMGYDTLIMGIRDEEKLREVFAIPPEEEVMAVIALGRRAAEPPQRPRKPLEDIAKFF